MILPHKLLFALAPETAHCAALQALAARAAVSQLTPPPAAASREVMGLQFANPLGLAAGFDKNGKYIDALGTLGFGFIEIGGVTPKPQTGNDKPRIFRIPEAQAIINRMGLNNDGMQQVQANIQNANRRYSKAGGIVGINLGRNAATDEANAAADYCLLLSTLYNAGDFFTLNISSPNTAGLRALQHAEQLNNLLQAVVKQKDDLAKQHNRRTPLLIKIAPDLNEYELAAICEAVVAHGIDGVIATNTTTARPPEIQAHRHAVRRGGLSGSPLTARANQMIRQLRQALPNTVALIGVGGVMSVDDAKERLDAGADLIQIYTSLIYQGPNFPKQIIASL